MILHYCHGTHRPLDRTIHPVWNESFETMVPSRVAAKFAFEIFDWDRAGSVTFYNLLMLTWVAGRSVPQLPWVGTQSI